MKEGQVVLICGGAGGIGSVLVDHFLADTTISKIYVTHRQMPVFADPRLHWVELDFAVNQSIDTGLLELKAQIDALDYFVCATGFLSDNNYRPEKSLKELQATHMEYSFRINAAGPLRLLAGLETALKAAPCPKIMFLSAQVGSIEDNHLGGWYSYRMAKAALNMGLKTAAIEASRWRNEPTLVAVHPGTTHTNLSQPFTTRRKQKVRSVQETGQVLFDLLQNLKPEQNGKFLDSYGAPLPW